MAQHTIVVEFDPASGLLTAAAKATGSFSFRGKSAPVTVSIPLCFDPSKPAPQLKRRKGESDEAYAEREAQTNPAQIDLPPELAQAVAAALAPVMAAVRERMEELVQLASARHLLAARGVQAVPNKRGGTTKQLKIESSAAPPTGGVSTG